MVIFDSTGYWKTKTWDRYSELSKVSHEIRDEFLHQESLFISCLQELTFSSEKPRVLDLACGTGKIAEEIIKSVPERIDLVLADLNLNTLNQAKDNLKAYNNIEYISIDAYHVGDMFQECFDVIVCVDFLHHISKPDILVAQINKALKHGGAFVGNVFNQEQYNEWDRKKYGVVHSVQRRLSFCVFSRIYKYLPNFLKESIETKGLARISPLTEKEIYDLLHPHFAINKIDKGYYIWFCAKKN